MHTPSAEPISPSDMDPRADPPVPAQAPGDHDGREQEDSMIEPGQHHGPAAQG